MDASKQPQRELFQVDLGQVIDLHDPRDALAGQIDSSHSDQISPET
jgi:hypothetical protein